MQASLSTFVLPSPLGFTTVRGLGLQEAQHLAGELALSTSAAYGTQSKLQKLLLGRLFRCFMQMLLVPKYVIDKCIHKKNPLMTATTVPPRKCLSD